MTITLARSKADQARALLGAGSSSEAIALALDRVIHAERLRRDIAAYRQVPPTQEEVEIALLAATALDDDTWRHSFPPGGQQYGDDENPRTGRGHHMGLRRGG